MHTSISQATPHTGVSYLKAIGMSALRDTLTSRSHSPDFAYARGDYLRSRVMVIGVIFLTLVPFWSLIDWAVLPPETLWPALLGRLGMLGALIAAVFLARHSRLRLDWARLSCGLLLATPAVFYALVLTTLPGGGTSLIGYSFIPYMLVAMLAIFPFTLLESAVLGAALIGLEAYALHTEGVLISASGLQAIWLLAALLVIAMTANYFQLGLMLRLYREATHDPLTGLLNRGAVIRAVESHTARERVPQMALLMMDLDHFKRINDHYGHASGDDVLRDFAGILRRSLRPSDLCARYGGEEFVAILLDADPSTAIEIAENIRRNAAAARPHSAAGEPLNYTVSIGVAAFQPGERFEQVAVRADDGLYEAKKSSRNCVVGV